MFRARYDDGIDAMLDAEARLFARDVTTAVRDSAFGYRDDLRGQLRRNFRRTPRAISKITGQNFEKTIPARVYPEHGESMGAAAVVYSTFRFMSVFVDGATIGPKRSGGGKLGPFLAIALPNAEKTGLARSGVARDRFKQFTKGSNRKVSMLGGRRWKLVPVRGSRGAYLLGLDPSESAAWGIRGRTRRRVRGRTVQNRIMPMFILVKNVTIRPRFDWEGPQAPALDRMAAAISASRGA